jgi:hypothetical protein
LGVADFSEQIKEKTLAGSFEFRNWDSGIGFRAAHLDLREDVLIIGHEFSPLS